MNEMQEKLENLENRVQLLEIIAKKAAVETQPTPQEEEKKVIQINANGKKYFCTTQQEQRIFEENNPNAKKETFEVQLPVFVADEYLNDPKNKEQFRKQNKE